MHLLFQNRPAIVLVTAGLYATLATQPAFAADNPGGWSGFIGVGAAAVPEFDGADKYKASPFLIGEVQKDNIVLQLRGLQARLSVITSSGFLAGPVVNVRGNRDDKVKGQVALLNEIDTAFELGGFVGYRFGGNARGQGQIEFDLTATRDVSGTSKGTLVTFGGSYAAYRSPRIWLNFDADVSYGDKKFNRTYFGVQAQESIRSGLAQYRPGSSLRDVSIGTTAGYQLTDHWGLLGRVSYKYLVGDVADSPIVRAGSRNQGVAALAVTYRY